MTRSRFAMGETRRAKPHLNFPMNGNARVQIHGTRTCGYCTLAQQLLNRRGIAYDAIDVTGNQRARAELIERANGRRTVPVIFIDGELVGGYQELAALAASGELDARLGRAAA
jgi:glutaredoxin 3